MPSFLSKVFGRKHKDDEPAPGRPSDGSLLEGKFEAVSPTVSPTANTFAEAYSRDKENGRFSLFRLRSQPSRTVTSQNRAENNVPHLSLNIPGRKDGAASPSPVLGVAFEANLDSHVTLSDAEIGERRLNTAETLKLVRACSQSIIARGLETLGVMHPHWYSASPDIQRKLISLFIKSLDSKTPPTTLPSSPSTTESAFESEINFTRSPHDVASVLRWALRHLQLDGSSFGKDSQWYENFRDAEKSSNYPPKAFTEKLVPLLPPAHLELLTANLELVSSIAAHAEANGSSGSKLSKVLGFWLLTFQHAQTDKEDWKTFYASWERAGRILEHLLLARIRDEAMRMPKRLQELVTAYPYTKFAIEGDDLLPRPRFSTRRYDALLVRVDTELPSSGRKGVQHPLRLIEKAFKSEPSSSESDAEIWDKIRKAASDAEGDAFAEGYPPLSRIFADDTLRLLSLIPTDAKLAKNQGAGFTLAVPSPRSRAEASSRPQSMIDTTASTNGTAPLSPALTTPLPSSPMLTDWASFSTAGFGESKTTQPLAATLLDKDVEKTLPMTNLKLGKKRKSPARRGASIEPANSEGTSRYDAEDEKDQKPSHTSISLIQLDEAFIDFWSDALLDPISATWPAFVICKLKALPEATVSWLIIEQTYSPHVSSPPTSPQLVPEAQKRSASPRPSVKSGKSIGSKKRFTLFGRTRTSSEKSKKKSGKDIKVGEMGEILDEEAESKGTKNAESSVPSALAREVAPAAVVASTVDGAKDVKEPPIVVEETMAPTSGDTSLPKVDSTDTGLNRAAEPKTSVAEPETSASKPTKTLTEEPSNEKENGVPAGISETSNLTQATETISVPKDETPPKVRPVIEDIAVEATKAPKELQTVQPPVKHVHQEEQILSDEVPHDLQPVANAKIPPQSAKPIAQEITPEPVQPVVEPPSQDEGVVEAPAVEAPQVQSAEVETPVHHAEEVMTPKAASPPVSVDQSAPEAELPPAEAPKSEVPVVTEADATQPEEASKTWEPPAVEVPETAASAPEEEQSTPAS